MGEVMANINYASFFDDCHTLNPVNSTMMLTMANKDKETGSLYKGSIIIFTPTNTKIRAMPTFNKWKRSIIRANTKYKARKPKIAKMLEDHTMKGSCVMAKIAGMLSIANTKSLNSMKIKARNKGVATHFAPS